MWTGVWLELPRIGLLRDSRRFKAGPRGTRRFGRWGLHRARKKGADEDEGPRRSIERTCRFAELYSLGQEVIAAKPGAEVRFAERRSDGLEVVVKTRRKCNDEDSSCSTPKDDADWRSAMEFLLNLPHHDGIAATLQVLEDAEAYYVVMERVAGSDLFEVLDSEGRLPVGEIREVLRQLLSGLAVLHSRNWVHRDLKLENVMLESTADEAIRVKLIDFDTLEVWSPDAPAAEDVMGTDQYIAPESYSGRSSMASDMFAFGVIAYRLLVGEFPFDSAIFDDEPGENHVGNAKMEAIRDKLSHAHICWQSRALRADPGARRFLQRLLAIDEKRRPTAMEALADPWLASSASRASVLPTIPEPIRPCPLQPVFAPAARRPASASTVATGEDLVYSPLLPGCVEDPEEAACFTDRAVSNAWVG